MTDKQTKLFWVQFTAACRNLGIEEPDRAVYRHAVLEEEAHVQHLAEVNTTDGFEQVMQRLAADAGDWERASRYMAGNARRIGAMVNDCARQVSELASHGQFDPIEYARGVLSQSGLERANLIDGESWYMDYPETTPFKVFQILDSYRRRLIWRRRRDSGKAIRLAYSFGTVYED